MLLTRVLPLAIHAPSMPDSYACSDTYGQNVVPSTCESLVDTHWPVGNRPIRIYLNEPPNADVLRVPYTVRSPGCTVSLESAGPNAATTHYVKIAPNKLRGLAAYLIYKCPIENAGLGGFASLGLENAVQYVRQWGTGSDADSQNDTSAFYPREELKLSYLRSKVESQTDGTFLTVSLQGTPGVERRPGDTDPIIAGALSMYAAILLRQLGPVNNARFAARYLANLLHNRAIQMTRGGSMTWWGELSSSSKIEGENLPQSPEDPGAMTYQCDEHLGGAPSLVDCEKLSWSGLKPLDSVETLEPSVPKFYSQGAYLLSIPFPSEEPSALDAYENDLKLKTLGTCAFGMSSSVSTTITWAHLLTAFDTLLNLCIQNPIVSSRGGRAYYGQQPSSSWINGKRDSVGGVNGWEALPMGINATIFKHDLNANMKCEWTLAQQGKDITMCKPD